MRIVDIICAKRDGLALTEEQISSFIAGYARGDVPDYQAASWCMAVFLNGMSPQETGYLTRAMINSGEVFDLSGIKEAGPFVDKHSTGGVGDKISLVLAPIAAACGLKVPMMSGRALGHTGGTLDKLDSIPGYNTSLSMAQFINGLKTTGFAMTGQSEKVVPADRKLYALRDVIGTVESIPLITSSILSKKFAEGAEALVMDVKCGPGAFMKTLDQARALSESLVRTGESLGRKVIAVITDMTNPLGCMVGNFLEVEEALDCLEGHGPRDIMEITYRLTAWMLIAGGLEKDLQSAEKRCRQAISDGSALELFRHNVKDQGGRLDEMDAMRGSTRASFSLDHVATQAGYITSIDAFAVGMAAVILGVGRNKADDEVDPLAGIELMKKNGERVEKGQTVMRLWAHDEKRLQAAEERLSNAISIALEQAINPSTLILQEIASQ